MINHFKMHEYLQRLKERLALDGFPVL